MKKKNRFLGIITVATLIMNVINPSQKVLAQKNNYDSNGLETKIETVIINSQNNNLLKEYVNQSEAINKINDECKNIIQDLKNAYNLEEFSGSNWEIYRKYFENDPKNIIAKKNYKKQYVKFMKFFDVYENKYKNDKVKQLINNMKSKSYVSNGTQKFSSNSTDMDSELAENLPNNVPFVIEHVNKLKSEENMNALSAIATSSNTPVIDIDLAVEYAHKHAPKGHRNPDFKSLDRDCANFASQVIYASGRSQNLIWFGNTIKNSLAWGKANSLANYFGVRLYTGKHYEFSRNIYRGDIVVLDGDHDNDWDHAAFVENADNYADNYNGYYYYDYQIAQHTEDYIDWTSHQQNHWEEYGDDTVFYGILGN